MPAISKKEDLESLEQVLIEQSFGKFKDEMNKLGNPPVVQDSLKFKEKLGIPDKEFEKLRIRKNLLNGIYSLVFSGSAVFVAQSSVVATTFFSSATFMGISIGVVATPVGWVVASVVAANGILIILKKTLDHDKKNIVEIPKYIHTPLDMLAVALFDLLAPIKLKMVFADNYPNPLSKQEVYNQFGQDWGYNPSFIEAGLKTIEENINSDNSKLVKNFVQFIKISKSVNSERMKENLIKSLDEIMKIDAKIHEKEKDYLNEIRQIIEKELSPSFLSRLRKKFKT